MAYDAIETPFGKTDRIVGGSAVYVAYAASNFVRPINLVSIIGNDFEESEIKALEAKEVSFEGVEKIRDKKSFFWSGTLSRGYEYPRYVSDRSECAGGF